MTGPIYTWKTQGNMAYSYEVVPKGIFRDKEATKEKVVSDSEPNIESLSLSWQLFLLQGETHSPSSLHHTYRTYNEEDDVIADCVPKTQNIDLIHKSSGLMSLLSLLICLNVA